MKNSLLITTFLISGALMAQTKVTVTVANFSFTSANVTINVGDTVEFINASGFHSVDGTQATYPGNPASFDNLAQVGTGWTYAQVFNTIGSYDYRCGVHTTSMFGTITVQAATGVKERTNKNASEFYPNPAANQLNFSEYNKVEAVTIFSLTGEKVLNSKLLNHKLDISTLSSGIYFVKFVTDKKEVTKKLIIK
jgi:plastocyanin